MAGKTPPNKNQRSSTPLRFIQDDNRGIIKLMVILLLFIFTANSSYAQIAIKAEKIYTMAGNVINNGVILCENDKITKIGKVDEIDIPAHYKIIEGKIATPGLIDAHSVVGLAGIYNQKHDQDQLETSDPIQPELRALMLITQKRNLYAGFWNSV